MDAPAIFQRVSEKFGSAVSDLTAAAAPGAKEGTRDPFFKVAASNWLEVARFLRDDPELRFDFLQNVTAVDWIKQNILQVVYHLYSYPKKHSAVVKIDLPRADAKVPSVVSIWQAADWNEREQFDLAGVFFEGHPDMRRIMMPDDWVGHPLRKDYKEADAYRGMPTTRPNTIDLLPLFDKAPADQKGEAK
jgi:NADH-quinone oxidoreductase subunit C